MNLPLLLLLVPLPQDAFPPASPESQGLDPAALAGIAAEVTNYVERDVFVGAELLIVKNRRTVLHEVFGFADRDDDEPWTIGTVCNIRSMTKPLTGAAVQILIDRGELSEGNRLSEYLPGFDTDAAREITVGQALAHRAGLPLTILKTALDEYPSLFEMGNAIGKRGPEYTPESRFWYSDAGTEALGALVEVVSEKRLDVFVREELLEPLGMTESFYYLDETDERRAKIGAPYLGGAGKWNRFWNPDDGPLYPYAWGSQSLFSTPNDYARFLALWMDDGRVGERALLSPEAIERTLTPVSPMSMLGSAARFPTYYDGLEVWYGQMSVLHIPEGTEGPAVIVGHSGSDGTIAWAWPERDLMILIFTQSRGGAGVLRIEDVINRLLINPAADVDDGSLPAELERYLGTYISDWANYMKEEFVVLAKNGALWLDIPSQIEFELAPSGDDGKWNFAIAPAVQVWFEEDDRGAVDCLRVHQGQLTFEAPRKGTPHATEVRDRDRATEETCGEYLGGYEEPGADELARVFLDGDYLAFRGSEKSAYHLWKVPADDRWLVRENPQVSITFQKEDGIVVSFTRHMPEGEAVVFPRVE